MSRKRNINVGGRTKHFSAFGSNDEEGNSFETAYADPVFAINAINNLVPPPSDSDPTGLTADVAGTWYTGISLPNNCSIDLEFNSFITFDENTITLGDSQGSEFGALLAFGDDDYVIVSNNPFRTSIECTTIIVGSDGFLSGSRRDQIRTQQYNEGHVISRGSAPPPSPIATVNNRGFSVTGVGENFFGQVTQGEIRGTASDFIYHALEAEGVSRYVVGVCELFDENQAFFVQENTTPDNVVDLEIGSVGIAPETTGDPSNTFVIDARSGQTNFIAKTMEAETVVASSGDGTLVTGLCNEMIGDIFVGQGSTVILHSVGRLRGNIVVETDASLTLNCVDFVGSITPSSPFDGRISGRIAGQGYGKEVGVFEPPKTRVMENGTDVRVTEDGSRRLTEGGA